MNDIHSEIRRIISALLLEEEPRRLLFAAVSEKGKSPYAALELLWLVEDLRAEATTALALFQRKELLQNLLELVRNGHKDWVGRVCHLLYVGSHAQEKSGGLLPAGMIRDLLQWVNGEQREKVREIIWAVLLQKGVGFDSVAKVSDVAPALCESDPITRNNAVRFLFEHFKPEEVVGSLVQFSVASGKSVPSVAYRRYVSLLKGQGGLKQNKEVVNRILSSATLEERHIKEIFLDYVNSLNRFELIGLLCSSGRSFPHISNLRREFGQMGFPFDVRKAVCSQHDGFSERCTSLWRLDSLPQ
ncbi:MAG: hypothetical protein R6X07_10720 [Desulfatiglandales bacterium]